MEHILCEESDHQALLVRVLETAPCHARSGERQFRFEEAWTRHDQYETMIDEAWQAASSGEEGLIVVWQKLGHDGLHAAMGLRGVRIYQAENKEAEAAAT